MIRSRRGDGRTLVVLAESSSHASMLGSTTWSHPNLGDVITDVGLVADRRCGDPSGAAPAEDDAFVTLVLRRP